MRSLKRCAKRVRQIVETTNSATRQSDSHGLFWEWGILDDFGIIEHLGVHADFVLMSRLVAS